MKPSRLPIIRAELRRLADPEQARNLQRYFKTGLGEYGEGDVFLGLKVPELRRLARKGIDLPLAAVRSLLRSRFHEERMLALCLLVLKYGKGDPAAREAIFRLYMDNTRHINNWDLVDCSAGHIVGRHLNGGGRKILLRLAASNSLWDRRIAIIATSYYIGQGQFADTIRIAEILLADPEDLIHKAVGWMLREVGKRDPAAAAKFLRRHCRTMPRTMLRYAIEKLPEAERRRYLSGAV